MDLIIDVVSSGTVYISTLDPAELIIV